VIVTDVNPLIYAFRSDSPFHELARGSLSGARQTGALVVLPEVAAAFIRIVTDARVMPQADEPRAAMQFIDAVSADGRFMKEPRIRRWSIFRELIEGGRFVGRLVPDALLVATCVDYGASILTADRDFLNFPGLLVHLMTPAGIVDHVVTDQS
jgi:toxin-antitoxin system PIN domain toxin